MDRKKIQLGLTLGILFAAYLIVMFLVVKNFTTQFWISLIFVVVGFMALAFGLFFVSAKNRSNQVVGLPVGSLVWMYFVVELVMGTIFMFFNWAFIAYFLPQFIVFVLFLLVFVPAVMSPNNYQDEPKSKE